MSLGAILMMIFGLTVTWGGAAFCLYIASRRQR
ncbi:MAG: MetS family NSS transporter small subunit [Spirochaetales bacterium]|nr:MetS family NSS transporter small subunit [Spirochaetales bacterium]